MTDRQLSPDDFYRVWVPLLRFVARREGIPTPVTDGLDNGKLDGEEAIQLRDALWKRPTVVDAFVAENPARLDAADLAVAAAWKHGIGGPFLVARHLKDHSVFLTSEGPPRAFAVRPLFTPLSDMFPRPPVLIRTRLMPFGGGIVTDGLVQTYPVLLGPGIRRGVKETLRGIEEGDGLATTLGPDGPGWDLPAPDRVQRSNAKVLVAFRRHLRSAAMTDRRCDEHAAQVRTWADAWLGAQAPPRRLVDATDEDLEAFLAGSPQADATSFVRFARFLRETGRVEPGASWALQDVATQARRAKGRPRTQDAAP